MGHYIMFSEDFIGANGYKFTPYLKYSIKDEDDEHYYTLKSKVEKSKQNKEKYMTGDFIKGDIYENSKSRI